MDQVYENYPKFVKKYPAEKEQVLHKIKRMEKSKSHKQIEKEKAERRLNILENIESK